MELSKLKRKPVSLESLSGFICFFVAGSAGRVAKDSTGVWVGFSSETVKFVLRPNIED